MPNVPTAAFNPIFDADIIRRALAEDVGRGDITTEATIPVDATTLAHIIAREGGVIAGLPMAALAFQFLDPSVKVDEIAEDGQRIKAGGAIAAITGNARAILTAERTALNFLGRLSGIATLTARCVAAVAGTRATIVDTRKTTPGLRTLEKYAVRMGGGHNHRAGLDDGVLIKDNHLAAAGGVREAITAARAHTSHLLRIEVECEDETQVAEAVETGADVILLDNMSIDRLRDNVRWIRTHAPEIVIEASGSIGTNTDRLVAVAATGVDLISLGALTHSAPNFDVSLEFDTERRGSEFEGSKHS